jgi:hypothetical protein
MHCPICINEVEDIYDHLQYAHPIDDSIEPMPGTITTQEMVIAILDVLSIKE